MENDKDLQYSKDLADRAHRDSLLIVEFIMQDVVPCLDPRSYRNLRPLAIIGVYSRLLAWAYSMESWKIVTYYQAAAAATRSMLEFTADLVFLSNDPTSNTANKIMDWADSAKLRSAEALVEYFSERANKPLPQVHRFAAKFIKENQIRIQEKRKEWGWTKKSGETTHPMRWTNSRLVIDLRAADVLMSYHIERHLGISLEEFYETEYRALCWQVHGTGMTDILGAEASYFNYARNAHLLWCSCFIMLCTEIILDEFGRIGDSIPRRIREQSESLVNTLADRRKDFWSEGN